MEDKRVFTNEECPYYPCHTLPEGETFNCVFCYCPLYALGPDCGGAFRYNEKGNKDCSLCTFLHRRENYGAILSRYGEIMDLARRNDGDALENTHAAK